MTESPTASDSTSVDERTTADEPANPAGSSDDEWGFWEDVVLFGVAFFGTLYVVWMLPYYFFVLDLAAGLVLGGLAVLVRRLGHLEGITDDGGTRFFQAAALAMVTPYAIAAPGVALGFDDALSMPGVKFGCVLAGAVVGAVWYRH